MTFAKTWIRSCFHKWNYFFKTPVRVFALHGVFSNTVIYEWLQNEYSTSVGGELVYAHQSRACGDWVWLIVLINACCYSCTTAECRPQAIGLRRTHSFIRWMKHSFIQWRRSTCHVIHSFIFCYLSKHKRCLHWNVATDFRWYNSTKPFPDSSDFTMFRQGEILIYADGKRTASPEMSSEKVHRRFTLLKWLMERFTSKD